MFTSLSKFVLLSVISADLFAAGSMIHRRAPAQSNNAIVQLFEWPWDSVAAECTSFLGPSGYGFVQVSPPNEHITGSQWWTDYQPVSYKIVSKRGSRAQFANMVATCKAAGVGIIADVVLNHMSAGSGTGIGGSSYSKYNYPAAGYTSSNFHYCAGNGRAKDISNYNNAYDVQNCELVGLSDLAQEQPAVRTIMAAYLNDLLSLGVYGFRIDAAKHMDPSDIQKILSLLSYPYFDTQEVIYGAGEAVQPSQYVANGDVIEFRATSSIQSAFSGSSSGGIAKLVSPVPMGSAWNFVESSIATFIIANQDTERGGTSLKSSASNNIYILAEIFMLGFNYGTPTVYSAYDYTSYDAGAPQNSAGFTNAVTCFANGWRCEHRNVAVANMVAFHNAVGTSNLTNIVVGSVQQIAFGRGNMGFVVINNDNSIWTRVWNTSLPAGVYCDIIHDSDQRPGVCTGPSYTVSASGTFTASVAARDALALVAVPASSNLNATVPTGNASSSAAPSSSSAAASSSSVSSSLSSSSVSSSLSSSSASSSASSAPSPVSTAVVLSFVETAATGNGETLKVVGSIAQLGSWNPSSALQLTQPYVNADWQLSITIPPSTYFEYKFIKVKGASVTWESGNNRVYTSPTAGSTVTLYGRFDSTRSSTSAVTGAATPNPVPASSIVATTTSSSSSSSTSSSAAPPSATGATVTFRESASTSSAETVKIVGSIAQLGNWAPASAVAMSLVGPVWSVTLVLPPNTTFQYKFIRTRAGSSSVVWESDPNRSYTTLPQGSTVVVSSTWR